MRNLKGLSFESERSFLFTGSGMIRIRWWPLAALVAYVLMCVVVSILIFIAAISGVGGPIDYWAPLHWPLKLFLGGALV